jgi:Protein of unknown function (DUF2958)
LNNETELPLATTPAVAPTATPEATPAATDAPAPTRAAPTPITDVAHAQETLRPFLSSMQRVIMSTGCSDEEEGVYFTELFIRLANVVQTMPQTYEQDGKGDAAVVHLHYFTGVADWYITEKDVDGGVHQAFGYAHLGDDEMAEMGYISIAELVENRVELDLHWTPITLGEVKAQRADANSKQAAIARPDALH